MLVAKRSRAGRAERMDILRGVDAEADELVERAESEHLRRDVAVDDILDALAAAYTARCPRGRLRSIPAEPEIDSRGLPMEMVYDDAAVPGGPEMRRAVDVSGYQRVWQALLPDPDQRGLDAIIERLSAKEAQIVRLRYGLAGSRPRTVAEAGREARVTAASVRKLEADALLRLRLEVGIGPVAAP